jgi:hypothetical protein
MFSEKSADGAYSLSALNANYFFFSTMRDAYFFQWNLPMFREIVFFRLKFYFYDLLLEANIRNIFFEVWGLKILVFFKICLRLFRISIVSAFLKHSKKCVVFGIELDVFSHENVAPFDKKRYKF